LRNFLGFSDTAVNPETAVMARQTGQRDRGVREIPGVVADRDAWAARDGRWPGCGRCRRDSRHARRGEERGGRRPGSRRGVIELSGKVFENMRDLVGDLLGAKNAGVTNLPHLK
jgi:hypothetical protein